MGLSTIKHFCCSEVFQVVVVCEYLYLVLCPFTVSAPVLKCVDDGQKFLVVDIIVDLRRLELSGVERHWVQLVFFVSLGQDSSYCEVRGVGFEDDRSCWIEVG